MIETNPIQISYGIRVRVRVRLQVRQTYDKDASTEQFTALANAITPISPILFATKLRLTKSF